MSVDLVSRAAAGDRDAFDMLLTGSIDRLYAVAERILRDRDRAGDAVQETLVSAWRDLPGLREHDRFEAWLHRLLVRSCYREARRRTRGPAAVALLERDHPIADDAASRLDERERIDRAFRRVSPEHRAALVVVHYLGLSVVDAAAVLGIPAGTVKSRVFHASRAVRAAMEADDRLVVIPSGRGVS